MLTLKDFKGRREAIERRGRGIPDSVRGIFYLTEVAAVAAEKLIKENNNSTKNAISSLESSKLKRKRSPRNQLDISMTEFNVRDARKRSKTTPVAASHGNKKERVKQQKGRVSGANPPPDMPGEFKNRIQEMGGTVVELIIQKPLFETDLKKGEGRLSIPANQIQSHNFLTDEEKELLNMLDERGKLKAIETKVIGPNATEGATNMNFKKWNMKKPNGSGSSSYVLTTKWNSLVASNSSTLKVGNTIQLWSFRQEERLCFALVVLGLERDADGDDS
ncbi:hypothetical protein K2173_001511 [Erythroxylum novogranatense]|uniref:B3 domain-containing protein n=1 Tax=Erythroxylum novogranatense TaxID=1862640 RepID=A0AAV8T3R3_9ROSI|nr:hypothetical protein K2173_001511 [Erythroxylum novogranatense]